MEKVKPIGNEEGSIHIILVDDDSERGGIEDELEAAEELTISAGLPRPLGKIGNDSNDICTLSSKVWHCSSSITSPLSSF